MIVGRLVQAMGGRITVLSEAGQGASFRVDLPLQAPFRSDAALDRSVAVSGSSALLIDSEDRGRADIEMMLKSWKVSCRCVASIDQATAILEDALDRGEPYDVILVADDGHLRNVLAFVERVREDVRSAGCSIVVMASSGLRGDAATASAAGADAYLRKPLDAERLLRCMQSLGNWDRNRDGIMTVHTIDDQKPASFDILVVDDNALNCKLAEVLLSRAGHRVVIAANGAEAVERVEAEHFDIVLMDIQMPVMNGLDATGVIRRLGDQAKSRIPIVAITANAMDGDARKCRDAGMNDYVTKPINGPDLLAVVDRAVRTVG
jgi:CheY-like chemotaxis protein